MESGIKHYEAWLRRNKSEKTIHAYTYTVGRYLKWLGSRKPDGHSVDEFITHLQSSGNSNSSAARHLTALRSYFKFLGRKSDLEDIEAPRTEMKDPDYFEVGEIIQIIDATRNRMFRAMVALQMHAGLRYKELSSTLLNDIDWEAGGLVYMPAKQRGTSRHVFIDLEPKVLDILKAYVDSRNDDHELLFCRGNGRPIALRTYNDYLRDKCEHLGIRVRSSHKIRHALATYLSENNVDIGHISIIMRHKNIATTMRYNHARREKIMENTPRIFETTPCHDDGEPYED